MTYRLSWIADSVPNCYEKVLHGFNMRNLGNIVGRGWGRLLLILLLLLLLLLLAPPPRHYLLLKSKYKFPEEAANSSSSGNAGSAART